MKGYGWMTMGAMAGLCLLLLAGCAGRGGGYYRYPGYYDNYYYRSPYNNYYWWPYRSYYYRDYPYHYRPRDRYRYRHDDDHRIGRPPPPQEPPPSPPPDRKPQLLRPVKPKVQGGGQQLDRPILRHDPIGK